MRDAIDSSEVPRLETPRLLLREWRATDTDAYWEMASDPEVTRYLGGTMDRYESWRSMALHAGHWTLRGYGKWAVERISDGEFLGRVGLWNPEGWPGLEVGWALARRAWGNGYATEAAAVAIRWAWVVLGAPRLISIIHPENEQSIRVAQRLGMGWLRSDEVRGQTVSIFGLERPTSPDLPAPE